MALQKGSVRVLLGGGVDTKTTPQAVPTTRLLALENGVFTRGSSIRKRNGYESVGDDSEYVRLATRDDELLAFTASRCYSLRPDEGTRDDAGAVFSLVGSDRAAVRTGTMQTVPDTATNEGVSVYAWEDSRGGVWYTVTDAESGRVFIAPTQAHASGISPRCVAVGAKLHVYFVVQAQGFIYVVVVNPDSPAASVSATVLADDLNITDPVYDACPTTQTGTPAIMAWHERSTASIRLGYVNQAGVLGSPSSGLSNPITIGPNTIAPSAPIAIAWYSDGVAAPSIGIATRTNDGTGNVVGLEATDSGSALIWFAQSIVTPSTDPQRIVATYAPPSVASAAQPALWCAVEEAAAQASNRYVVINWVTASFGILGTPRTQRSVGLASRAWTYGDDTFAYFVHDTTYFNVYVALRLSDSVPVARTLPGLAASGSTRKHVSSATLDGSRVTVALPYKERLSSENADQFTETGIRKIVLDYDDDDSHQHAQIGRGMYLGGACPQHYDGRQWTEQGFHIGPELIATANGTSGSLTPSSTYLYRVWYEWTDAQGEIHRGPVSFGTLVTLGASDDDVTLTLPTLRLTRKPNVRLMVARSRAAETGATAELFVVSSRNTSASGANGYVANNTAVDTVTFNDRMSDAVLETQEPLYTNGGILSTDPSSLGHLVVVGKGRLFFNDPSDSLAVRYSQTIEPGYAAEVPPEFVLPVPADGGAITSLAVGEDGTVLVFKREAVFAFSGLGPLPNGDVAGQGFTDPLRLRSPVGCDEPQSIAVAPNAVLFKSPLGIWQVDGAGQISYVGAPVEGYNSQRVTAATPMPGRTQILFLCESGNALLYDYLFGQWSTFTNHDGRDAAVVENTYHYLRSSGRVYREMVGSYSDAGLPIRLRLETAWIHLTEALQGFQRIWNVLVLGTWLSPHQLAISHRVDYAPGQLPTNEPTAWDGPRYLDATGEAAGATGWVSGDDADTIGEDPILGDNYGDGNYGDGPYGGEGADVYQWRYHVGERGQSLQLRFEDFEKTGLAGACFELTELLIEGGVAGPSKKPFGAARSV